MHRQLHVGVREANVEVPRQDGLQVTEQKELLPGPNKCLEHIVDGVVLLEDKLLLIDFDRAFKVNAVVEEFHERLDVQFMLHLLRRQRLDALSTMARFSLS